jgi:ABC-2 type transport system permease protein
MKASLTRIWAILLKEWIQMRRDRLTFAMILGIPVMQLVLFGFAINTDPRHLPAAVHLEESSPVIQRIVEALGTSSYFDVVMETKDARETEALLASGKVLMVFSFPAGFTRDLVRGQRPPLLVEADATDPVATGNALAQIPGILERAVRESLTGPLAHLAPSADPIQLVLHRLYNPEGITQFNIVPGLLGVILTMTMVLITSIAMTREMERGTMENLLAMPTRPFEVMIGKIAPYIVVGLMQTGIILWAAEFLFHVPFLGSPAAFFLGLGLFILANLALGFTFSTIARSQLQAMQMTFFFFLPSILLSGFMFPFQGMPGWARTLGEILPLTHFLRIVRSVMLKAADSAMLWQEYMAIGLFLLFVGTIAVLRYRTTLD